MSTRFSARTRRPAHGRRDVRTRTARWGSLDVSESPRRKEIGIDTSTAKFSVGQVIEHLKFGYRGVIIDVDPVFSASDEWYDQVARSRPPKDKPWYHVLVEGSDALRYVAERHLGPDESGEPIGHPEVGAFFDAFEAGRYTRRSN